MNNKFIPVNIPKLYSSEKTNVINCVRTNWISSEGKFVKEFEKKFSQYNSRKFGVAVSSGTAALEVAIKALNLKTFLGNKEERNTGIFENFLGPGVSQFINSLSLELGSAITEI